MDVKKWAAGLGVALVLPMAHVSSGQAATGSSPKGVVVVAASPTGSPLVRYPGSTAWRSLGGTFQGRPAVVFSNNRSHFFASTTRGTLMHRTASTPWRPLTRTPCSSPHAAAYRGQIRVACIGARHVARTMVFAGYQTRPYQATLSNLGGYVTSISVMVDDAGYVFFATGKRYPTKVGNSKWTSNSYVRYPGKGFQHWDTFCTGPMTVASSTRRVFVGCQLGKRLLVEVFDWTLPQSSPNFYKYWF
ncbi:MAG: hypothetical protein L0H22_05995, partial [Brevibacterium aurantiacum]|nr:hypothetical protein [Brevibacterium aurantiacum]